MTAGARGASKVGTSRVKSRRYTLFTTRERAAEHFEEGELSALLGQIVAINAWNRFNVAVREVPKSLAAGGAPS